MVQFVVILAALTILFVIGDKAASLPTIQAALSTWRRLPSARFLNAAVEGETLPRRA